MDFTNKPKVNILLAGLSGVGKTSLCQAFGTNFVDGFSYGVGLSKKAKIVELKTEQNVFHIVDAPGIYDPRDISNTQRHGNEISKKLNLFSTPYVICFVICIQQHDMRVKYDDIMMMRTIKQYYGQGQVKFSVIINRLTENEFQVFADNSHFRKEFLGSFERDAGIPITDDDILLIHDKFLTYSIQDRKELLSSYLKKFEAGHMSDFAGVMNNDSSSPVDFMAAYTAHSNAYRDEIMKIINQNAYSSHNNSMQMLQQSIQEQQMKQSQLIQQMLSNSLNQTSYPGFQQSNQYMSGSNNNPSPSQPFNSPFASSNGFLDQYLQQSAANSTNMANNYINSYLNSGINQSANPFQNYSNNLANAYTNNPSPANNFQQAAFPPTESSNNSSSNNMFNAAGAFVGGAMGIPTADFSQGSTSMYGAAGQFVGGAVTAGCSIM